MAQPTQAPAGSGADRVYCPLPHREHALCWLCGSFYKNRITVWVLEQWIKAGSPWNRPA
jgi:hypothetical protein